jgi:general secretion pathway protein C
MLDLFFRKYAWTANLLLIFAAAWFGARIVNTIAGSAIRPRPQADAAMPPAPARAAAVPVSLETERLYRLIGQEPPSAPEAAVAPPPSPQNCDDPNAAPARSGLRLQLVAAVQAERPQHSLATIVDLGTRETHVVGIGEEVGGARLVGLERLRIERDATGNGFRTVAVVCNGGTKEYLDFDASAGAGAPAVADAGNVGVAPVPPPRTGGPAAPMEGIRTLAANRYEIDRNVIDQTLSNLNVMATQARIVPSFKNGVANGFKLFSIQPNSLYAAIGVENGDVIQRVNGYEINSPEKALELYQRLRESQHVTIELERAGQVIRKEYNIAGP